MSAASAIQLILKRLSQKRLLSDVAEASMLDYSRLRRLRDGVRIVDPGEVEALRRFPGFSAEFDELVGSPDTDAEVSLTGRRLHRAFPEGNVDAVVNQIEKLSTLLDAQSLADILESHVKALLRMGKATAAEEKLPVPARKLSKNS